MTPNPPAVNPIRIITYIDGFNLYYGLKDADFERYLWLDLVRLSLNLLKPGQKLTRVKYLTSRITRPDDKRARQCVKCGSKWIGHEEKMTDVNIATQLLIDAYDDGFDCALVISGDSDVGAAGQNNPPAISAETHRRRFFTEPAFEDFKGCVQRLVSNRPRQLGGKPADRRGR